MKITVYTIADCQFSKQEKEYLISHSLQYEEKSLETNKDFLTEMLAVSNNFAGTPVTRVEKDDGTIAVLKGFTKEEFDTTFGFKEEVAPPPKVEEIKEEPKSEELNAVLGKLEEKTAPEETTPPPDEITPPAETLISPTDNPQSPTETPTPPTNSPLIPNFPQDGKTSV